VYPKTRIYTGARARTHTHTHTHTYTHTQTHTYTHTHTRNTHAIHTQIVQQTGLASAATLQASSGAGNYTVYAVAVDRSTGMCHVDKNDIYIYIYI